MTNLLMNRLGILWQRPVIFLSILLLLLIVCYLPGLQGGFFIDDGGYTINHPLITETPISQFWRLFVTMPEMEYLPLRDLSYLIDYQLFADNPLGYKLHNLLLYLLLTMAVWLFSLQLMKLLRPEQGDASQLALLLTALYVFHPSHVESVSWISGRKDLLAALFTFLSLWQFTLVLVRQQQHQTFIKPLIFSSLLFVCALLSKSVVVPLGAFALLLALWVLVPSLGVMTGGRRALLISSPLLVFSLLGIALHSWIGSSVGIGYEWQQLNVEVGGEPISLAIYILLTLLQICLWPFQLRLQYDVFPAAGNEWLVLLLGTLLLLTALWGALQLFRRSHPAWLGLLMFVLFATPYLQLMLFDTWSLASERFVVIAVYGVLFSMLLLSLLLPKSWRYGLLTMLVLLYAGQSGLRAQEWSDSQILIIGNWQSQPAYFSNVALRVRNVDMVNADWTQAIEVAQGIKNQPFREAMVALVRFQENLSQEAQGKERLNRAWQQLKILHQAIEQSKGELRSLAHYNFYRDITGLAVDAYLQMLPYAPESVQIHFRIAQMLLNHNDSYAEEDALKHLNYALQFARKKGEPTAPIIELMQSLR